MDRPQSLGQLSIHDFLAVLGSKQPVPGGGAVAALTGALAVATARMVAAYTRGHPKYGDVQERIGAIDARLERAVELFERLMDEDAAAYAELNRALKISADDPGRKSSVQAAALVAASVPLEMVALVCRIELDVDELLSIGNKNLASDAEIAGKLVRVAGDLAISNVTVNLSLLADEDRQRIEAELEALCL